MNLTNLFEERSAAPPGPVQHDLRMAGVRQKVATRRRRRLATGLVAVLVAAVALGVGDTLPGTGRAVDPASTLDGFPDYYEGSRTVAATAGRMPEPLELTITPTTTPVRVFWRCDAPSRGWWPLFDGDPGWASATVEFRLDGELFWTIEHAATCASADPSNLYDHWVVLERDQPGRPTTITATLVEHGGPVPDGATWGIAVAEPVPFEEYEFPPRPDPLPPLARPDCGSEVVAVERHSEPAAPLLPVAAEVDLGPSPSYLMVLSQTPGLFTLEVDDQEVARLEVWDYDQQHQAWLLQPADLRQQGLPVRTGDQVTLRVTSEHVTGDWAIFICQ